MRMQRPNRTAPALGGASPETPASDGPFIPSQASGALADCIAADAASLAALLTRVIDTQGDRGELAAARLQVCRMGMLADELRRVHLGGVAWACNPAHWLMGTDDPALSDAWDALRGLPAPGEAPAAEPEPASLGIDAGATCARRAHGVPSEGAPSRDEAALLRKVRAWARKERRDAPMTPAQGTPSPGKGGEEAATLGQTCAWFEEEGDAAKTRLQLAPAHGERRRRRARARRLVHRSLR